MGSVNRLNYLYSAFQNTQLAKYGCLDLAKDDVVFVAGSGRSGTSWLANICNYENHFRYIFEPLNPTYIDEPDSPQWCLTNEMSSDYLDRVLQGKVSNRWVNSRNRSVVAKRRLIKEIRSNLMLNWVIEHYPKTKIVLLLRNPFDIAISRKSLQRQKGHGNWVWHPTLQELLNNSIVRSRLSAKQYLALLKHVEKGIELETIAEWCINNLIACDEALTSKMHLVYYENLITDGQNTAVDLMNYIEVPVTNNLTAALTRRSETSRGSVEQTATIIDREKMLTKEVVAAASELLELFDYSRFYHDDNTPVAAVN